MEEEEGIFAELTFVSILKKINPPISKEICRVCRSGETEDQPLFYPCKCSGSIRYVHQDW